MSDTHDINENTSLVEVDPAEVDTYEQAETVDKNGFVDFAREHPILMVAGGLVAGVAAAALLRSKRGSQSVAKVASGRGATLLAAATEIGIALSRQARAAAEKAKDTAEWAAHEGKERFDLDPADIRKQASRLADEAITSGKRVAEEAKRFANKHKP